MSNLEKKNSEILIGDSLGKLQDLLETAISISSQNREKAIAFFDSLNETLEESKKDGTLISEDGILEEQMNKALAQMNQATKGLEGPINALVKLLSSKIFADAIQNKNKEIKTAVDISETYKSYNEMG